jgi:Mn2+/Fe2+ NRAMP family transporter
VPIGAALVWVVVVRGSYKPVERILIVFSLAYLAYPISAFLAHPDWHEALRQTIVPQFKNESGYLIMLVGLIGTTITPWMQFYLQASVVEKGITQKQYGLSRWDVIIGCIVTDVVAFFIVVACAATLFHSGHREIGDAAEAAVALRPFAGQFASLLFGVGLVNASLLSAAILPLATAYNVCEGLGFESGVDHSFSEAPVFYWLYTALIVTGAGFVLIPGLPLLKVILLSQVANGILIPFVLLFMLALVNRAKLMGEMKNGWAANAIAMTTSIIMIGLTVAMVWTTISGAGG